MGTDRAAGGTRQRLLDAGLRLFAERGFDAVSVGEIERAVGLVPRRGALYRHFASKDELLEAATGEHLRAIADARARFSVPAVAGGTAVEGGIEDRAAELARWILGELDRQRAITRVLEREGDRLPQLRETFRREVSDPSYAGMATILRAWLRLDGRAPHALDEGLAVHLLGALVNARRSQWTFGPAPAGQDDDALVRSWSDLCRRVVSCA